MIAYLAHPYGGDRTNLEHARRWLRWMIDAFPGVEVIAPWILTCEVLDDKRPEHRARGVAINRVTISRCDVVILVGSHISAGMLAEVEMARDMGIKVLDLTSLGALFAGGAPCAPAGVTP